MKKTTFSTTNSGTKNCICQDALYVENYTNIEWCPKRHQRACKLFTVDKFFPDLLWLCLSTSEDYCFNTKRITDLDIAVIYMNQQVEELQSNHKELKGSIAKEKRNFK